MGLTQVLPGTGAQMAQELGVPWRPDLMTATTDEGADYQRRIGQAYLDEGLERTGNTRDALRYYHGGPNRGQWGPKTNAYADKVLSLAGPQEMPPNDPYYSPQMSVNVGDVPLQPMQQPTGLAGILQEQPDYSAMQQKKGAFDKGGKGWVIAGIIADAIAGGFGGKGGFAPTYLAAQDDERQLQALREKTQAERAERMDTSDLMLKRQIALEQYKRANPAAPTPSNAAKMAAESGLQPGTPEFAQFIRRYAQRPIVIGGQAFGYEDEGGGRSVVRTGTDENGRQVVQYSDGSIDYAD